MKIKLFFIFCVAVLHGYEVSVCAIFRDEAPYLKEWIEFHKIQGVEHFYLYNNNSADNYLEVLQPYIEAGAVTLVEWPYTYLRGEWRDWKQIQNNAYMDCIHRYGEESVWIAFIDLDEFLFCPDGTSLGKFLEPYWMHGAVCVNWVMFGTSGIEEIPPGQTMIENLIRCASSEEKRHLRGKSIVQPKNVQGCEDAHTFLLKRRSCAVDVNRRQVLGALHLFEVSHDRIRINHYWTRTESWFRQQKGPSRNERREKETFDILCKRAAEYNECTDTAILRFVPLLREKMGLGLN